MGHSPVGRCDNKISLSLLLQRPKVAAEKYVTLHGGTALKEPSQANTTIIANTILILGDCSATCYK